MELQKPINEGATTHWINEDERYELPDSRPHRIAQEALKATPPFHFPIAFPQVFLRERAGFDVILGNPPWEITTLEEDRFWTRYVPGLQSLPQFEREKIQSEWREQRPDIVSIFLKELAETDLVRSILIRGPYPGMGTGLPDLYKGFVWRFWALVNRPDGRIGVVLPRVVFSAKGSAEFRQEIFLGGTVEDLTNLVNNAQWVFDNVHPQYTVTLLCLRKLAPDNETTLPMRGPYASKQAYVTGMNVEAVRFSLEDVLNWTATAALPLLPDDYGGASVCANPKGTQLRI